MSLFQAVFFSFFAGVAAFLPFGSEWLHSLVSWSAGWEPASAALRGTLSLGFALSLLVSFRHDWAGYGSALLGRLFYRGGRGFRGRRPDEQLPIWIAAVSVPMLAVVITGVPAAWRMTELSPGWVIGGLFLAGEVVHRADRFGKRQKGMFDFGVLDCLLLGLGQLCFLLPGVGRMAGMLSVAFFRGYQREAACRFILLSSFPILLIESFILLRGSQFGHGAGSDLTWLQFGVTLFMAFFLGLLSKGALERGVARFGASRSFLARLALVGLAAGGMFLRKQFL
jgi:undecaprenyl pyrophosphate phosphatase UppP